MRERYIERDTEREIQSCNSEALVQVAVAAAIYTHIEIAIPPEDVDPVYNHHTITVDNEENMF